jgi:hypothetical protein
MLAKQGKEKEENIGISGSMLVTRFLSSDSETCFRNPDQRNKAMKRGDRRLLKSPSEIDELGKRNEKHGRLFSEVIHDSCLLIAQIACRSSVFRSIRRLDGANSRRAG